MNDDDYFLRGDREDWRKAIEGKPKNTSAALSALAECKELLAPYVEPAANEVAQACAHQYEHSERFAHSFECVLCGAIIENTFKFQVEQNRNG